MTGAQIRTVATMGLLVLGLAGCGELPDPDELPVLAELEGTLLQTQGLNLDASTLRYAILWQRYHVFTGPGVNYQVPLVQPVDLTIDTAGNFVIQFTEPPPTDALLPSERLSTDRGIDWERGSSLALGLLVAYEDGNSNGKLELYGSEPASAVDTLLGGGSNITIWYMDGPTLSAPILDGPLTPGYTAVFGPIVPNEENEICLVASVPGAPCTTPPSPLSPLLREERFELLLSDDPWVSRFLCTDPDVELPLPVTPLAYPLFCAEDGLSYSEVGFCGGIAQYDIGDHTGSAPWPCWVPDNDGSVLTIADPDAALLPGELLPSEQLLGAAVVGKDLFLSSIRLGPPKPELSMFDLKKDALQSDIVEDLLTPISRMQYLDPWLYYYWEPVDAFIGGGIIGRYAPHSGANQYVFAPSIVEPAFVEAEEAKNGADIDLSSVAITGFAVDTDASKAFVGSRGVPAGIYVIDLAPTVQSSGAFNPMTAAEDSPRRLTNAPVLGGIELNADGTIYWVGAGNQLFRSTEAALLADPELESSGTLHANLETAEARLAGRLGAFVYGSREATLFGTTNTVEIFRVRVGGNDSGSALAEMQSLSIGDATMGTLVTHTSGLYWYYALDGSIRWIPPSGGPSQVIFRGPLTAASALIAVGEEKVFWITPESNQIYSTPRPDL